MEKPRLFLGLDIGTTGAKAIAVSLDGTVAATAKHAYRTRTPHPGWAEQDPGDWIAGARGALGKVVQDIEDASAITAIGLTGQSPTIAPFGADGHPVAPGMLYRDNRATKEAASMRDRLGEQVMHRRTGHVAGAFHIAPKILWLREHAPDVYKKAVLYLQPRDVVLRDLTGVAATDESHATCTLLFDLLERRWAGDLFETFGLEPSIFPPVVPSATVAGSLLEEVAGSCGLGAGIPVVIGAGDSQCAAFGAGVVDPGPLSEMAGSSSCLNTAVNEPVTDLRVTHYPHVVPDRYTTELGINTAGAAIGWAAQRFGFGTPAALAAEAERFRSPAGGDGAPSSHRDAPMFFPYLSDGERDDPSLRAALLDLSERHDQSAIAFAVLEGVALAVGMQIGVLRDAGCEVEELRVSGGAARSGELGRIKADVAKVPCLHLPKDATDIGAALLAAAATGLAIEVDAAVRNNLARSQRFEPDPASSRYEQERMHRFEELLASEDVHHEEVIA